MGAYHDIGYARQDQAIVESSKTTFRSESSPF